MKTVFSIIFVLLVFNGQFFAQTVGRSKSDGLAGQVHSLLIENFDCSSSLNTCLEKPFNTNFVLYDRKGNEIERTLYKTDGSIEHQVNKSYNGEGLQNGWKEYYGKGVANAEGLKKHAIFTYRSGKLTEVVVYREDAIAHKSIYAYDNKGNKIQELNSGPDAIFTNRSYKYDSAGNLIEESSVGKSYSTKVERSFDSAGNVIKERNFDNGSLRFISTNTYENGRLINVEVLNPDGAIMSTTQNRYNSLGKLVESIVISKTISSKTTIEYDEAGWMKSKETVTTTKDNSRLSSHEPTPGRIVIRYSEKGLETESLHYSELGMLKSRQTLTYNEQRRLSESIFYKANGEIERRWIYEYDEYGNLVKTSWVILLPTGETKYLMIGRRTIKYFVK
jgi:antitoxin component YwqK of YwqJK toxin-antitoxin module